MEDTNQPQVPDAEGTEETEEKAVEKHIHDNVNHHKKKKKGKKKKGMKKSGGKNSKSAKKQKKKGDTHKQMVSYKNQ